MRRPQLQETLARSRSLVIEQLEANPAGREKLKLFEYIMLSDHDRREL